jgi:hypothetical protein
VLCITVASTLLLVTNVTQLLTWSSLCNGGLLGNTGLIAANLSSLQLLAHQQQLKVKVACSLSVPAPNIAKAIYCEVLTQTSRSVRTSAMSPFGMLGNILEFSCKSCEMI